MSYQKYFWQGEPVKTDFGCVTVKENLDKPLFWYNFECNWNYDEQKPRRGTVGDKEIAIPAIKITTRDNYVFYIANHFGIGAHKLKNGGWPSHRHFSFDDGFIKFEGSEDLGHTRVLFNFRNFDLEGFEKFEAARRNWQKENYPNDFEASENLRKLIQKK